MTKFSLVKIVDLLSFIFLVFMISTGLLLYAVLPPRSRGAEVWGMTRHDWGDLHFYISLIFLGFMSLHLILHIKFLKEVLVGEASQEHKYRIIIGLIGLVALVAVAVAPLFSTVKNKNTLNPRYHMTK
jgi:hypothetical protein